MAHLPRVATAALESRGLCDTLLPGNSYVGRNAVLPLFTQLALSIAFVVGGSVIIERYFSYPGLGLKLSTAILDRDYPVMQGVFLIITISVVFANLLADYVYGWLDPRVRIVGEEN